MESRDLLINAHVNKTELAYIRACAKYERIPPGLWAARVISDVARRICMNRELYAGQAKKAKG